MKIDVKILDPRLHEQLARLRHARRGRPRPARLHAKRVVTATPARPN